MDSLIPYERYHRQLILPGFGEAGQQRLQDARVLIIGAGGLGCPVLQYLAGAGVGCIGVVDDDLVSLNNLHRQPVYCMDDLDLPKATVAVEKMRALNPDICINAFPFRLTNTVCADLFPGYSLIIDGTDNFPTRYMINDAAVLMGIPFISGAVSRYEGQVMLLNSDAEHRVSYRDLFPEPPQAGEVANCAEAGVLGPLPGIIGSMMAAEAIKWITGIGRPLTPTLLTYSLLEQQTYTIQLAPHPGNQFGPATMSEFLAMDYPAVCGMTSDITEIDPETFARMIGQEGVLVVDVREPGELPLAADIPHQLSPLSAFPGLSRWTDPEHIVFFCQAGVRSLQAARRYQQLQRPGQQLYSLRGGILAWVNHQKKAHV
jgi:adenylyltransferase/sulfurtransferase